MSEKSSSPQASPPTSPPCQIRTRSKNKNAHPGAIVLGPPRRPSAEVQRERAAKTKAKAAQQAEKQQNIQRAAAFELADMVNEDIVDVTPRPAPFTAKPWPPHNRKKADLAPIAEVGNDPGDSHDPSSLLSANSSPPCSEYLVAEPEEEPASGSDSPIPAKKLKAQTTKKATMKVGRAPRVQEKLKAALPVEEVAQALDEEMAITDEEPPQKPKPKRTKVKLRDEIDLAAKKMQEDNIRNGGGDMEKPTSGQQTGEELSGSSAPKTPSQVQWRRPLKRAAAIANIDASCSDQPGGKRTKHMKR